MTHFFPLQHQRKNLERDPDPQLLSTRFLSPNHGTEHYVFLIWLTCYLKKKWSLAVSENLQVQSERDQEIEASGVFKTNESWENMVGARIRFFFLMCALLQSTKHKPSQKFSFIHKLSSALDSLMVLWGWRRRQRRLIVSAGPPRSQISTCLNWKPWE